MIMPSDSRKLLLLVRSLLLALAAGAAFTGFVSIRGGDAHAEKGGAVWACPMHPEVRSTQRGDCPICRMALEPVKGASASPGLAAEPPHAHSPAHSHGPQAEPDSDDE